MGAGKVRRGRKPSRTERRQARELRSSERRGEHLEATIALDGVTPTTREANLR
jgi:hypothetical protein